MLTPDERIDSGFASLRASQPQRTSTELVGAARRRARLLRLKKTAASLAGCLVLSGAFFLTMRPTSALAALMESARMTAAQPIIHVHFERQHVSAKTSMPAQPATPPLDIWKFRDRYIRKEGRIVYEAFRNGKTLSYDSRFSEGIESNYDPKMDRFWQFGGTLSVELSMPHRDPPTARNVFRQGRRLIDYEWKDTNGIGNRTVSHIYVDPDSKLVRYSTQDMQLENGDTSHGSAVVRFPKAAEATREEPQFPTDLKFRTREELIKKFDLAMHLPEQSKFLAGIQTTLYGVVITPNIPDGLAVDVITQGGAGPDIGSGNQPKIVGLPLLPVKRSEWFQPSAWPGNSMFGGFFRIGGRRYIYNQSDDLLVKVPAKITVRIPVWRLNPATIDRGGVAVHPHDFVGFVTFTTIRIFTDLGDLRWSYYDKYLSRKD